VLIIARLLAALAELRNGLLELLPRKAMLLQSLDGLLERNQLGLKVHDIVLELEVVLVELLNPLLHCAFELLDLLVFLR